MSDTNETAVLFPDRTLTLSGEAVTVREFKYLEGLKIAALAAPLLSGLSALFQDEGQAIDLAALDGVILANLDVWTQLLAQSCGKSPEWVSELSDVDGTALGWTFWEVNGPFLLRRVAFARRFGAILAA